MNRIGMIVDLAHVAAVTMHAALNTTVAPVMFSHSGAYAICNNVRNVPDDVLARMPANGGVVMVNFFNVFVSCSSTATLSQVADHIDYIVLKTGSAKHVGYGSDFDGVGHLLPTVSVVLLVGCVWRTCLLLDISFLCLVVVRTEPDGCIDVSEFDSRIITSRLH